MATVREQMQRIEKKLDALTSELQMRFPTDAEMVDQFIADALADFEAPAPPPLETRKPRSR